MPLYTYKCIEHGDFDKLCKIEDRHKAPCPNCDRECPHTPQFKTSPPVFKGDGFHSTDYSVKEGSR